ncbi:hypothetical protein OBBRIDRAFT_797914 [Obba rivulosa]|uniref:Monopolin complex subunit Csm1/Pcs1 C-terminal domain-containing protein n=1 Tax=Obba rivulosa TaxID=1052685 RepID=A0A8E2DG93_9APHY|nr:hypothetical protein OBBRIDRAFT_797914 [Obba rivulosa]
MSEIEISGDELDAYHQTGPSAPARRAGAARGRPPRKQIAVGRTAKKTVVPTQQVVEMESEEDEGDVVVVSPPVAGSSAGKPPRKQPASKGASKKPAMYRMSNAERSDDEDAEDVAPVPPAKTTSNRTAANPTTTVANGRTKASAKGKGRADQAASMEVDDAEVVEVAVEENDTAQRTARARKANPANAKRSLEDETRAREHEHMRKQLANITAERDKLSKQLEELFHVRHSEPEAALQDLSAQYEAKIQTQASLIQELTSQIARLKTSTASEKGWALHFLTREAADEEKAALEQELRKLKDQIRQRDVQLAQKDKEIAGAEAQANLLRSDLEVEIERGKALARNAPPTVARAAHPKVVGDHKNAEVIKLYEDMTNFLVINVRIEKSPYFDLEEPVYTCMFSNPPGEHAGQEATRAHSLTFQLRKFWQRSEDLEPDAVISERSELVQKMQYTPMNLERESEDFVNRLDFLKDSFTFAAEQTDVFLKTLKKILSAEEAEQEDDAMEEGA